MAHSFGFAALLRGAAFGFGSASATSKPMARSASTVPSAASTLTPFGAVIATAMAYAVRRTNSAASLTANATSISARTANMFCCHRLMASSPRPRVAWSEMAILTPSTVP